jgi:hypothetical protein
MAVLELYGKCKELGYCDCGGFWGCHDPKPPAPKQLSRTSLGPFSEVIKRELQR